VSPEVAVVTGASAGVGRAVVRRLARDGALIGLVARGEERLEAAAREVESSGGRALVLAADVADPAAVEDAAERVEHELGPIDIWINNAMATIFAPSWEIEPDEFRRATEVTYLGTVWGTMAALRRMRTRDRGTIVQVGSALAYRAIPLQAPYCGAKAAIRSFTESLRTELLHEGSNVRVTMVQLPAHNTPQFEWGRTRMPRHPQPVPPIFQPEVAAEAIVHSARRPRRELYVGWPTVKVVLAEKLAPGLVDRYLARTGFDSQQTEEPVDHGRPDNLFDSTAGDYGAHGTFDAKAKDRSIQLWLNLHRGTLAAGVLAGLGALRLAALRD
jgi:NAD(P)-dependent dehydrogenase (short-subunit alcohol dehydrogenase family)